MFDGDKQASTLLVLKEAIKGLVLVDRDPLSCLRAGGKQTITPHVYRAQTNNQPAPLT